MHELWQREAINFKDDWNYISRESGGIIDIIVKIPSNNELIKRYTEKKVEITIYLKLL